MKIYNNSKGFTLIEVMIAMAIFAIGILGATKLQITATDGNTTSRTMSEAAAVVMGAIEKEVINNTYTKTTNITASVPYSTQSGMTYSITRQVNNILNTLTIEGKAIGVKQVKTTIRWGKALNNYSEKEQTFTITTYRTE